MAATYSKPTGIPRWADTSSNVVEPSSGKKDEGWLYEEVPPSSYENWRAREVGRWFKWLNERLFDGTSKDIFVIKQPGDAQEMFRLEADWVYLNEGQLELTENSGVSDGGELVWNNTLRTSPTYDDARWRIDQFGSDDSGLRFGYSDENGVTWESVMGIYAHINGVGTEPFIVFTDDITLLPGGGSPRLGIDSARWSATYTDNFFQTNKAHLYAYEVLGTPINMTAGAVITPATIALSQLMTVASRQVTFSRKGIYRFNFNCTWVAGAANVTLQFSARLNGSPIVGTGIQDGGAASGDPYTSSIEFLVNINNPASDYVEFYGLGNATATLLTGTAHIIKEEVTT